MEKFSTIGFYSYFVLFFLVIMVGFVSFFLRFFFIFLSFIFTFSFVFSDDLNSSDSGSVLKSVRGVIFDLANDVYLYETVLFDPSNFFLVLEKEDIVLKNNSVNIILNSSNIVKSEPVLENLNYSELKSGVIPKQLFDITFNLQSLEISDLSDLVGVLTFENFGSEPIPVEISFEILDFNLNVVLSGNFDRVVGTEESVFIFFRDYGSFDFIDGDYSVVLTSFYGDGVEDDFEQKFTFVSNNSNTFLSFVFSYWVYFFGGFVLLFIIFLVFRFVFNFEDNSNEVHSFKDEDNFSNLDLQNEIDDTDLINKDNLSVESNLNNSILDNDDDFEGSGVLIDDDFEDLENLENSSYDLRGVKK